MNRTSATLMRLSIAVAIGGAALLWSGQLDPQSSFVSSAEARIGRPLTPMSYAGVARRTTRRAVAVGATGAAVYGGAVVVAPMVAPVPVCRQAVDAYGRIVTVC